MNIYKHFLITFFIVLATPIWFGSCGVQERDETARLLEDGITSLKTDGPYHFTVDLEIGMTTKSKGLMSFPVEEHITIEGDMDPAGQVAKTTTRLKVFDQWVDVENIYLGTTVYSKSGAGQWNRYEAEEFDTGFVGLFDELENLTEIATLGTETTGGVESHLVSARFAEQAILETFVTEIAEGAIEVDDLEEVSDNLAQAWLGPDFLPGGAIEADLQYWLAVESRKISRATFILRTLDFKTYDGQEVNFKWAVDIRVSEYGKEFTVDAPTTDGTADG